MGDYSSRPVEYILQELKFLKAQGVKLFYFVDEIFGVNRAQATELLSGMVNLGLKWGCQTRFDLMDREFMALMAKAGCQSIGFGLESASEDVLKEADKRIDFGLVSRVIKWCREFDIEEHIFLVSFLPKESPQSLNETKKFLAENNIQKFSITALTPLPGSKLWRDALSKGIMKKGDYAECLKMMGQIDNAFDRDFVLKKIHTFPTEVALSAPLRFKLKLVSKALRNHNQVLHYFRKLFEYLMLK
jgi:radical SAM superfamily enzyme YgiQ (UPF0313 family)